MDGVLWGVVAVTTVFLVFYPDFRLYTQTHKSCAPIQHELKNLHMLKCNLQYDELDQYILRDIRLIPMTLVKIHT